MLRFDNLNLDMKPPDGRAASLLGPIIVLMIAMACFQVGATLAKSLFPLVGATGATALRTGLAAVMLCVVWRPCRMRMARHEARAVIIYGLALGCMNLSFYGALKTIPLGLAVAIEFTGPLAVAVFASRRAIDFVWIALAGLGLLALLPLAQKSQPLAIEGIALALLAGGCWALYIIYGRRAGISHGGPSTALGMLVSSLFIVPIGLAENGTALLAPRILLVGCLVALVSSALPYSLEMIAMPKIPTRTLGVLLSLDPVLGAVAGFALLGEHLSWLQGVAIGCIMVASAGSASAHRAEPLPE
jgi:inner membrane transporter RhtA